MSERPVAARSEAAGHAPKRPASRRRRLLRGLLTIAAVWLLSFLTFGCTSTVTPPVGPVDPVEVFVLEEAMHTGLVLPPAVGAAGEAGEYVEFGFGDWSWYALGNDAWYDVFATVLWPTQGGLGRRTFGARTADELRRAAFWATLSPVVVARADAAALRRDLQEYFDRNRKRVVVQPRYRFRFVPAESSYWFPHNCTDEVADWLARLGCDVGWVPVRTGLSVAAPE